VSAEKESLVAAFTHSWQKMRNLCEEQEALNLMSWKNYGRTFHSQFQLELGEVGGKMKSAKS